MNLTDKINLAISYIIGIIFLLILFSHFMSSSMMRIYLNSDSLYLPSLFQDLFIDKTGLRGWHLNGSPNFFPDMVVYFLLMGITRNVLISSMIFSIIQYLVIMFLIADTVRLFNSKFDARFAVLTNYILLIFILSVIAGDNFLLPSQLIMVCYHTSMVIMSLLCLNLSLRYLRNPGTGRLIIAGLLIFLGSLSDRLFLMTFTVPAMILTTAFLIKPSRKRSHVVLLLTIIFTTILGQVIFNLIRHSGFIFITNEPWKMYQFDKIGKSFTMLMDHMGHIISSMPVQRWIVILASLFILVTIPYLIINLKKYFTDNSNPEQEKHYNFMIWAVAYILIVFLTPVINGAYVSYAIIRFNFHALVIGSVATVYLLLLLADRTGMNMRLFSYAGTGLTVGLLVLAGITLIKQDVKQGLTDYIHYYPENARVLDSLKETSDLSYGIAEYWDAKLTTTFSRTGVRVYTVHDNSFAPWYHVMNENWYHDGGKGKQKDPVFNFIVADGFKNTEKVHNLFGDEIDTIYNQDNMLIVKVPEFKFRRDNREIYLIEDKSQD